MVGEIGDVDRDVATAVGLYALSDANLHEVATEVGVTSWELEEAIVNAGLAETFDISEETDVRAEIDRLLDEEF